MDNVIEFPKKSPADSTTIRSKEDTAQQIAEYKMDFGKEIADLLANHVFDELGRTGAYLHDDLLSHMILVKESILSLYLRAADVDYPLQEVAMDIFSLDCNDEDVKTLVDKDEKIDYNNDIIEQIEDGDT